MNEVHLCKEVIPPDSALTPEHFQIAALYSGVMGAIDDPEGVLACVEEVRSYDTLLVARVDMALAGIALYRTSRNRIGGRDGMLSVLAVEESYRGRHQIGPELLKGIALVAAHDDVDELNLVCGDERVNFYSQNGYSRDTHSTSYNKMVHAGL